MISHFSLIMNYDVLMRKIFVPMLSMFEKKEQNLFLINALQINYYYYFWSWYYNFYPSGNSIEIVKLVGFEGSFNSL